MYTVDNIYVRKSVDVTVLGNSWEKLLASAGIRASPWTPHPIQMTEAHRLNLAMTHTIGTDAKTFSDYHGPRAVTAHNGQ